MAVSIEDIKKLRAMTVAFSLRRLTISLLSSLSSVRLTSLLMVLTSSS